GVLLAARANDHERSDHRRRWLRAVLLVGSGLCMISIVVALRRSGVTGHLAGLKVRAVDLTLPLHVLPVLAYAWVAVAGRERPRERLAPQDWLLVLGPAALVMYLLTLTPTLTVRGRPRGVALFHWIYAYVPGAAAFRAPGRWALAYALPLALVAG